MTAVRESPYVIIHIYDTNIYILVAMEMASEDALARFESVGAKLFFLDDSGQYFFGSIFWC